MKHHIRTAAGVSEGYIKWSNQLSGDNIKRTVIGATTVFLGNIGGIGQGGGSSPIEWLAVLLVIINTFKEYSQGATVIDPGKKNTFKLHVLSYVDDNSILRTLQQEDEGAIFQKISQEMTHWLKILQLTGGDLALQKCHLTVLKWKWGPTSGIPSMIKKSELPGNSQH